MESSILSEVDDTSILRTGSPRRYGCPLNWLPASRLAPRAAGWSAATLCIGTKRNCLGAHGISGAEGRQTGLSVRAEGARALSWPTPIATGNASLSLVRSDTINRQRTHEDHNVLCRGSTKRLG